MEVPGVAGVLVGVVELAAGIEPVETIRHHRAGGETGKRVSGRSQILADGVKER